MDESTQFLEALFGQKPDRAAVGIWVRDEKPKTWYLSDLKDAAKVAVREAKSADVYIHCGLAAKAQGRAQRTRLKPNEVIGIPGVWADIDVNGGPDAKSGAAPTAEAALELAGALLEPTLLVNSGYGVQAWWLWDDGPMIFERREEQDRGARVVAGFQGALRAAARRLGWGLDAVQDLSRVMRLPGTFNYKDVQHPQPVTIIQHDGKLYSIDEVQELGQGFMVATEQDRAAMESGDGLRIEIRHGVGLDSRVQELVNEEPEFMQLWQMKKGVGAKRREWSASEFELSIANWLVRAGLDPQACADTLVRWRGVHEPGDPRKKLRPERLARTIGKAMSVVEDETYTALVEDTREQAVKTLETISIRSEPASEAKVLANFNGLIGGPEISRLFQYSRDPHLARYAIELADGRMVPLGPFDTLASQATFRKVYANVTGHYPMPVKPAKWDVALAALLKIAVVTDEVEDSGAGQLQMWIEEYLEATGSNDRDGACFSQAPFVEDGATHLTLNHFLRYLRRTVGEKIESADLANQLRSLGYVRKAINYARHDGTRSTRSYFVR